MEPIAPGYKFFAAERAPTQAQARATRALVSPTTSPLAFAPSLAS